MFVPFESLKPRNLKPFLELRTFWSCQNFTSSNPLCVCLPIDRFVTKWMHGQTTADLGGSRQGINPLARESTIFYTRVRRLNQCKPKNYLLNIFFIIPRDLK